MIKTFCNRCGKELGTGGLTMASEWISVKDRLPDEEQDVLILVREIEFFGKHLEKRKTWN